MTNSSKYHTVGIISLLTASALSILMMPSTQAQNYGTSQTGTRRAYSSYGSPSSGSNSYSTPTSGSSSYSTSTSVPSTGSPGSSSFGAISTPVGSNNQGNPTNNGSPASQNSATSTNPPSSSSLSTDSTNNNNNNNNSSTATSSTGSDLNSTSSTRSSKFGSFMRGLKHELNSSSVVRNPGYQNSNYNSPSSGTGLNTQTNGMPQVPPGASVVRNLDGTYRINAPGVNVNQSFRMQERAPQISGDVTALVTSNMPIAVTSDIDSLFPQELHAKAYGPELKRNAPLNGAEGRN
jgi:hypothetical protein